MTRASAEDFELIKSMYQDIIDNTPDLNNYTYWRYGLHPNDESIQKYIEEGAMYIYYEDGEPAAVAAVLMYQTDEYRAIPWAFYAKDDEVATVHILAVLPKWQKHGIAKKVLQSAEELAKENGKKALRLDTLITNLPGQQLYNNYGMTYRGMQNLYIADVGFIDFLYFEKLL